MHVIVGDEPSLDMEGVWLFRGPIIPQEMHDNPQMEYYKTRELKLTNAEDLQLITDFWTVKEGEKLSGRTVQLAKYHK